MRLKPVISLALALAGCGDILPLCDAKDNATPWAHPEHWPGTTVQEPPPIAVAQEAVEQLECQLGI
jgi:hypothetical protein